MEKRNICLTITQIRSHVNFGNNLREAKPKKVRFYFVTLKWHRSTCYVNWTILTGDPVDVTTLLLAVNLQKEIFLYIHLPGTLVPRFQKPVLPASFTELLPTDIAIVF